MELESLGWGPDLAESFSSHRQADLRPARVAAGPGRPYRLFFEGGECLAATSGRLRHRAESPSELPVTGDWVAFRPGAGRDGAVIHAVLPRRTRISRKVAGEETEEQVVAANVDTVLLVMGLDGDFNLRRLERYLIQAREGGVAPVVVLNKVDVCAEAARRRREAEAVAADVAVLTTSAATGEGVDGLSPYFLRGRTLLLAGSSGVGKSTLVNRLVGRDVALTRPVREHDDRGRHTTVRSELIVLPGGALLVDTPGLRELRLWSEGENLDGVFDDVAAWAAGCRFRDCRHGGEPGCAVRDAVDRGELPSGRLEGYQKLQSELDRLRVRQDQWARLAEKRRWRSLHRAAKAFRPRR